MLIQVGELAKRAGMTVRTLHHYEQTGLLTPSARSGRVTGSITWRRFSVCI
jgi:DNA-binding transcriptional MerR regulator